ncbi:PRC-barrel domain-containing protein [Kitasatospora sp. NPDC094015]|uniref:PRC-barrel domain-containing protein n=1 Tax=Kitasatospora sp. NPDC094015 TaxID=3155205 RepID=UPI003318D4D0
MGTPIWNYRETAGYFEGLDLIGYHVEAADGRIGRIDRHSAEVDASYLVVDTGKWIFGKQVLLPAGTITRVDTEDRTVQVDRTKDQIKDAPEFQPEQHTADPDYLNRLGGYYLGFPGMR